MARRTEWTQRGLIRLSGPEKKSPPNVVSPELFDERKRLESVWVKTATSNRARKPAASWRTCVVPPPGEPSATNSRIRSITFDPDRSLNTTRCAHRVRRRSSSRRSVTASRLTDASKFVQRLVSGYCCLWSRSRRRLTHYVARDALVGTSVRDPLLLGRDRDADIMPRSQAVIRRNVSRGRGEKGLGPQTCAR
jgi:hypothetical protein